VAGLHVAYPTLKLAVHSTCFLVTVSFRKLLNTNMLILICQSNKYRMTPDGIIIPLSGHNSLLFYFNAVREQIEGLFIL
jgi:hypothetical protein